MENKTRFLAGDNVLEYVLFYVSVPLHLDSVILQPSTQQISNK
jgi:hypothetical protein